MWELHHSLESGRTGPYIIRLSPQVVSTVRHSTVLLLQLSLDIPPGWEDIARYTASTAHKANHSFR